MKGSKPSEKKTKKKKSLIKKTITHLKAVARGKKISAYRKFSKKSLTDISNNLASVVVSEKEEVEREKFIPLNVEIPSYQEVNYNLPLRYFDNRIVLLVRDPWWLFTYWDISENKINEVISSIPIYERENLRWILRVYELNGTAEFKYQSFFDLDIHFEAFNWYINVDKPETSWCVEIGLKNPLGKFFPVCRSNIVKTPSFGISSLIDEEWALPDEDYYRVLGIYDLGRSSLERKQRFEEIIKHQISSHFASWGISSLFSERIKEKDKFFLEVWTELILYGRTEPDATVTVEGKKVNLRPDGTFSLRYALPVGDFKFEVVGTSKNKKYKIVKIPAVKRFNKE